MVKKQVVHSARGIVASRRLTARVSAEEQRPALNSPTHDRLLMGSNTSRTRRPTTVKTQAVVVSRLPQEIIDEILGRLATDSDFRSLRSCALVSKSWVPPCRRFLFHTVVFTRVAMERWLERFPVPEESPAHLVKDLYVWIGAHHYYVPDKLLEYTPWFINATSLSLLGYKGVVMMQKPSLWRSPQSVTSLTIKTGVISLMEIRDIMAELPNLDSLWLSGALFVDRRVSQGVGTVLRGRFGGKLRLCNRYAGEFVTNMLLEIPTGIHFTEVQIECPRKLLPSTVRLLEACGRTLVRLSYMVDFKGKSTPPGPAGSSARSIDTDFTSRHRWRGV